MADLYTFPPCLMTVYCAIQQYYTAYCIYQYCATRWHFLSPLPHRFSLKGPPKGPSDQTSQITPRRCPDSAQIPSDSLDPQTLPRPCLNHFPALPGLVIVIPFLPDFLLHAIRGLHAQKVDSVYSLEYCIHSTVLCIHISARELYSHYQLHFLSVA